MACRLAAAVQKWTEARGSAAPPLMLTEEFNKLSSLYGLHSLQPAQKDPSRMSVNLKQSMEAALSIDGALATALVDYRSGMCMAQAGSGINLDLANNAGLFLYLVLDKNKGNLALARYKLTEIERSLRV
jgi:hypothetical protein